MNNIPVITAVYFERRYFWHMIHSITDMVEMEEHISPEFRNLVSKFQKEMDDLYLDVSDTYHEVRELLVKTSRESTTLLI